LLKKIPMNSDN